MTLPDSSSTASFAAPRKIVVATDLADMDYLLPHAIAQAKSSGASLILLHAVLPHESMPVEAGAVPYYDPLRLDRDARLMLENVARDVREQNVECTIAVRHGYVPDVVAEVAANAGAGRLIVGTHGRRGLKKFVLGSVARQVLEMAEIPVCTVGPRARHGSGGVPQTILHPVSLGGLHEISAALSMHLGRQFGAEVVLLHAIADSPSRARDPEKAIQQAMQEVERLIPVWAKASTTVRVKIAGANLVSEILSAAQETRAGLIVLGVHAPAHSWLPGTEPAAYKILVSAPCPVLSLRVDPSPSSEIAELKQESKPLAIG
jgi:nucleotide-binding universal stress UspA family protein